MARLACLLLFVCPAALLAADDKPDAMKDLAAMKGKWKVTSTMFDGKETKTPAGAENVLVFSEKDFTRFEVTKEATKKGRTLAYVIDPSTDTKQIDLTLSADKKALGIYVLDGDTLTLCYGEPGAPRPKKPESKAGEKNFLLVLTRIKEKEKK